MLSLTLFPTSTDTSLDWPGLMECQECAFAWSTEQNRLSFNEFWEHFCSKSHFLLIFMKCFSVQYWISHSLPPLHFEYWGEVKSVWGFFLLMLQLKLDLKAVKHHFRTNRDFKMLYLMYDPLVLIIFQKQLAAKCAAHKQVYKRQVFYWLKRGKLSFWMSPRHRFASANSDSLSL